MQNKFSLALLAAGLISFHSLAYARSPDLVSQSNLPTPRPLPEQRQEDLSSTKAIVDRRKYLTSEYIEQSTDLPHDRDEYYASLRIKPKSHQPLPSPLPSSRKYDLRAPPSFSSSRNTLG